ncbi:MAG: CPBP family intramembrane glutamic endopeptidase [Pseudomonadota bacterium]
MSYEPHDSLIRPGRTSSNPARLIIGCVMVVAVYLSLAFLFAQYLPAFIGADAVQAAYDEDSTSYVFLMLFQFVFMIVALSMVLRTIHRRQLRTLIGRRDRAIRDFWLCVKYLAPLYIVFWVMPMPEGLQLEAHLQLGQWLFFLPIALCLVMIQISAEELLFRGYLQSQLAAQFRQPLVWIAIPSVLFGLLHYSPALAGENAWMLVLWAALFGVAAADLTARSGTLGPALALHFINNVFAILFAAPEGNLDGAALYTFPLELDTPGLAGTVLPLEILMTLCAWLCCRLAIRA